MQSNEFTVNGSGGLMLVVFHAAAGSRSADLLGILGGLVAPGNRRRRSATKNQS